MTRQLTFDLPARPALGRDDFFISPANAVAVASVDDWARWPHGKMALIGPKGAGKTHLVHVWAAEAQAQVLDASGLATADVQALASPGAKLAVEDVDRIAGNPAVTWTTTSASAASAMFSCPCSSRNRRASALSGTMP